MKGLINIQNIDNNDVRWCLVNYLNFVDKNLAEIRNVSKEFVKQLSFKDIKLPYDK